VEQEKVMTMETTLNMISKLEKLAQASGIQPLATEMLILQTFKSKPNKNEKNT
jgi:hypothetical protein